MVSKNNAKMVQRQMADQKQKFGIRKLSVGVASVLLGTVFYMQSGTVYADVNPVASDGSDNVNVANEKSVSSSSEGMSSPSNSASSDNSTRPVVSASDAGNSTATSQVSASSVKNTTSQVSNLTSAVSGQESSSSASQVNVGTDNIADGDNINAVSSSASVPNSQASTSTGNTSSERLFSTLSLPTNQISAVNASSLLVSEVALTGSNNAVNGGFDQSTWGKLNVNDWKGNVQGDYYQLTDYTGDANHVIVPNEADFAQAGISTSGKQVGVTSYLMHTIFRDKTTAQDATVAFSKTDNKMVKAINAGWDDTWGHAYEFVHDSYIYSKGKLTKFDGSNLDVANITNMQSMFRKNQISDLSSLANWKTDNVTNMQLMFSDNHISDLSPLANWNVSNVTNMSGMFNNNVITKTNNFQAKRVINFAYPDGYTGKKQNSITQTIDVPQRVKVNLTTKDSKPSNNILDWVTKTAIPEMPDTVYFQDYTVPEIKGLLEPDKTVISRQRADITRPINVTVTYKLVDSNTNDAFALDSKNGLHEHANVNDNGGYDKDYWGALDVSKFTTVKNGDNLEITGYTGDASKVIIPNITDFEINNLDQGAKQVTISSDVMHDLAKNATRIGLSKTNNQKVVASDAIWQDAFGGMTNDPQTGNNANGGMWVYNPNLTVMDLHNLDTTNITNLSAMFNGGRNLNVVGDLSQWNTANVTNMRTMFQNASSLTNIGNLNNWDTSKVTDMTSMFNQASKLTNIGDLSKWNTGNVTNMANMFSNATNLTNIGNLDNWNTSKVTDMHWMFGTDSDKQSHLTNIGDLSKWDTGNVTDMNSMFNNATNLANIGDLSKWQTGNVTDMHSMFYNATNLTNIGNLDNWNTSKVTNMANMFCNATNLTNIGDLSKWNTGNVTNMHSMFANATNLTNIGNLDNWNTSKVTDMSWMFGTDSDKQSHLTNIGDLSKWDTGNVTDMNSMFYNATNLTNIGALSKWNTGNVTNMHSMFANATNLTNIGNLDNWNTSKVTDMSWMFGTDAGKQSHLTNIGDLSKWDTGNVTDMNSMFNNATNLTNIGNLDNWNTSNVTDMSYMFNQASKLTNIGNLSKWNVSNVTNMSAMFQLASSLTNIGNLDNWNTSNVTDMSYMFNQASKLTNIGDLSKWQTGNVTNIAYMFVSTNPLRHLNISNWNLTKLANKDSMGYMFANDTDLTIIANDLALPVWYQNEINDADYFWNHHIAVITNVPELIKSTGDIDNLKIDNQDASRSIFYDSKGSSDALAVLKQADQDYIKQYQQTHPGYALNLAATLDQTNPIALANAEFTSSKIPQTFKINFVDDANGQIVASSSVEQALVDTTLTLDSKALTKLIPEHYYFTDANYSIPTSFNYQHVTDNLTIHLTKAPVYTFNLVDDTSNKTASTFVWDGIDGNHHLTGTVSDLNQKIKQAVNAVEWKNAPAGAQHGDVPKSANLVTPVTDLTALPTHDTTQTAHFTHATQPLNEVHDVSQVIHYVYQNGSKALDDHVNSVHFVRDGYHDEFSNTDHWNTWTPSETYKFDAVPTPVKTGYTADIKTVPSETVTPESNNIRKVVTYTPDAQKLNVKFIDDTTGQVLKTVTKTGVTNENAGYNTQSDVQSYEGQHYVLVSDSSHGASLVFDNDDNTDQAYEVHLKHGTHPIDEHHTITQTVHYIATDHASVPDDHTVSVQFDRDGYHDEVTGDDHWNAWKQGSTQTFAEVPAPKKAGYTPDKPSVPATVVHPLDHNQTIDVTYTPDTQKVIVTFIDDTDNGKTLKTVTKTGPTNSSVGYTTGDDINVYKGQHYVLVSDQTHGQTITFDTDTNTDQRYEVHLKHGTHQINDHRTITETVHYKMTDGTTAPTDYTAKVEFRRDGFNDEVTGDDHWNAWTPSATHQFDAVHSPAVKGYTPDTDQINAVTVNPDSQSIERTVTYTPDIQKLDVTFIDDTTGETLKTVVKNGVTNADANYSTKSDIQNYESQHYVLVSDSSNGAELVFDNDDAVDQHYEVHLKHATHAIDEHHTINETVHYKMSDGTKAPNDYQAEALSFSRDGFNDEVTGIDHWNAWAPKAEQTFGKVASPLVAGYTPDIDQINTQTVKPTDHDLEFTVTYTPNVQIAHVKYIDDTDHKVLTQDDLNGRTGETSGYHTTDRITEFKGQHYVFVSDNYPATGMTFDNNDRFDQMYEVHFKHGTRTDEQDVQVPRTIKYVYQNGQQAQPDHSDALSFHETKVVDLVDGHTVSDDWTPAQDFETVMTPAIQGYTPDHASVSNTGIAHDHSAIVETVTYNPDAQKAVVKYIDDTTGEQLEAKDLAGVSDQSTGYTTKETIDGYINQHYVLISDGTHGETVVFDHDDDADQSYEVHLKHGTEPANKSRIKKITVHYQYADGLARSGKAADGKTVTNLTFKRTGTHDLVTDKIAWNAWDQPVQTFAEIDSPVIDGYTPDRTIVDNVKVNPDSHDLTEVTVTYNADSQKLSVDFIDDTTGKTLKTVNKIGHSDEDAGYNTKADIQNFVGQHYDLVSDETNGENLVFDHDDNIDQHYEVHLSHHTHPINEHHTITETVHYQYADGLARSGKAVDDFNAAPLSFSRDGFNDEVTGVDHWNAWTPADQQTFVAVPSPVIEGYTPDQSEIGIINVVPTSQNIEKTVTYTADAQKLTVNFIDDTTGKTLKTVAKTGHSDESADYDTKSDVQNFVGQHYDLVSDETKGADLVFDHNDGVDQVYNVHFTHHLTPISDHQVVNETIHYVYAHGLARTGKAADDYTATPLEFNRTGKHDDVTGTDSWNAWIPGSANFATVQSPAIQGYTPDQAQVTAVSVDANSQDIVKTVTYSADQQTVTVDFIDDTDGGKVLKTVTKTGGSEEAVGYNTKADIQTFVDGHYRLDRDTTNGKDLVFDHDDATDQHYEVHLTHETAPISETTSTNQVIHYQLADGTPVITDYTAKVDFSRDGFKDLVTNVDHWNAWTPNATQTFDAVVSPAKVGYTPDHAQVYAVTVEPHHADLETTVTYSPDPQKATVEYVDDVTGKTLQTKELTGVSDETSTYTTASTIKQYVGQHYKLVSDQTNGKPVTFDHDDGNDQTFVVHLTHTYQSVSQEHQVHQTIHYCYADGKQARPDYTAPALAFSRTGTQDLVTENIQWNAWTPDQVFAAVNTPAVNGYTPDIQTVAPVKVGHESKNIEQTVIYHADDQTILVNYIDDDTHSTLKTDSIIGKTAQTSDYTTKKSLDQYKGQHYDVVSDDTHGNTLKFDSDSTKVQTYNVHLKHQHQAASDKSTVRQTVHYVYQDGKQAAKDHVAAPIEFTRTGDTDLVTGKTTWNAWTPDDGTFVAVISPVIVGYTPSRAMIDHVDVHPGDKDLDTTVTYVPDRQVIVVNYIDQVTGKTLKTDTLNGLSDQISDYTTKSQINNYLGQHYKLISDETNGQTLTFDHNDQATQTYDVVLGHQTEAAHRTHEVHETVDYVYSDGSQAAKSFTAQPLVFSQTGVHDLVTNTTDWNGEWTKPQTFAAVESPKITGFTASEPEVKAVEVSHQSSDVHELVIYAANAQTAQIKYIDDVTRKTLEVDGANGHFNESIVFSHNVNDQINKFKQAHYKLVSNNFVGQKYQADNAKNVYEVHLTHERQNVHATDTVTETIKFQYADGSQAQPTKIQAVNFGRDGIKDLVTGTTAWMPVDPQTIGAVDVPALDGYTADIQNVPAVTINFGNGDITKVVTYKANDQLAGIKYIDDTTGTILDTEAASGNFGTKIEFMDDPSLMIQKFENQGYKLVSNSFAGQAYQADNSKNQFEVHFEHGEKNVSRTSAVTRTIKYVDQKTGKDVHQPVVQTLTFAENGVTDLVTGKTTWETSSEQQFDKVESPMIDGYENPDISVVNAETAKFGDGDQTVIVNYRKVETSSASDTLKTTSHSTTSNSLNTSVTSTNTISKETQNTQTTSQNISIRTSQTSTSQANNDVHANQLPQTGNKHHTNQLPQTGNANDRQLELLGFIGIAFTGLFGFGKRRKKRN